MSETTSRAGGERGGIITGWLLRLLLILAIFAVGVFEAGAVVVAKVQVDGIANEAATEAAHVFARTKSKARAKARAEQIAERRDGEIITFEIVNSGKTVVVTAQKNAKTIFIHSIGPLKDHTVARATAEARVL